MQIIIKYIESTEAIVFDEWIDAYNHFDGETRDIDYAVTMSDKRASFFDLAMVESMFDQIRDEMRDEERALRANISAHRVATV